MQRPLGLLVCCLLAGRVAEAQEAGQDPRVGEAKTACVAGDVPKGIRLLAELYTASGDPIWIFNQGRCYQQNDQLTQALSRFKEFLRKSQGAPGEDVRDAQKYIAEIEAELQQAQTAAKSAYAPPGKPAATASTTAGTTEPEAKPGRGLRYAGVSAMVVGGAALAAGVAFSVLMNKTAKDIESQTNNPNGANWSAVSGKYADGSRYETLQWISYGVGAAASIAGGVLYWMGATTAEPRVSATHVFPVLIAYGAGAGLHTAF
jgi:hypothetical protein